MKFFFDWFVPFLSCFMAWFWGYEFGYRKGLIRFSKDHDEIVKKLYEHRDHYLNKYMEVMAYFKAATEYNKANEERVITPDSQ